MTDTEATIALALAQCTFLPASHDKRFVRDMAYAAEHSPERALTERQAAHLRALARKYRRQLAPAVLALAT